MPPGGRGLPADPPPGPVDVPAGARRRRAASRDWDESLDRVVDGVRRIQSGHGNDAVATYGGASMSMEKTFVLGKFARVGLGTRYTDYNGRMCMVSAGAANFASFGVDRTPNPISDLADADVAVVLGANVGERFPIFIRHYWRLLDRGGTLIVVDPRETALSRMARLHLAVRPGTDAALLLAMLHVVIDEDLVDHGFVTAHTTGFDEVAASVADWTPERAAGVCGMPAGDVCEAAPLCGRADRRSGSPGPTGRRGPVTVCPVRPMRRSKNFQWSRWIWWMYAPPWRY
ncbi:MAG: molybdopterin oxidoreductase family protein [Thermocrispum sp.]